MFPPPPTTTTKGRSTSPSVDLSIYSSIPAARRVSQGPKVRVASPLFKIPGTVHTRYTDCCILVLTLFCTYVYTQQYHRESIYEYRCRCRRGRVHGMSNLWRRRRSQITQQGTYILRSTYINLAAYIVPVCTRSSQKLQITQQGKYKQHIDKCKV